MLQHGPDKFNGYYFFTGYIGHKRPVTHPLILNTMDSKHQPECKRLKMHQLPFLEQDSLDSLFLAPFLEVQLQCLGNYLSDSNKRTQNWEEGKVAVLEE